MIDSPNWGELLRELGDKGENDSQRWKLVRGGLQQLAERTLKDRWSLTKEDVEDLVEDMLAKLLRPGMLKRVSRMTSPEGFLVVALRNSSVDLVRRRRVETEALRRLGAEIAAQESEVELTAEGEGLLRPLGPALASLSTEERGLLHEVFWKDKRLAEVAREQGIGYSAVAVRMFRLLRKLRGSLEGR